MSILLMATNKLSPYNSRNSKKFSFRDSLWFCFSAITPIDNRTADCYSGRFASVVWWLFNYVFYVTYLANLTAFLTIHNQEKVFRNINSLDDLIQQFSYTYSVVEGTSAHQYFIRMSYIEELLFGSV